MADGDETGIYLRSRGLPSGGETPGAGIFLNPQGGLDVPSFSDWFSGLAAPDQGAISAAIANLGAPDPAAASTDPAAGNPPADPNAVPTVFGTPAGDPSTLPATFSPDGGGSAPPSTPNPLPTTFTPQAASSAATPATNLPGVPGNPTGSTTGTSEGLPTVNIFGSQQAGYAIDQNGNPIPIPGSNPPVNTAGNPILNEVENNFTGRPAANIPAGVPQLGNNPPATPQPTAPNAAMTPDMQAYVLSRMNLTQPALGGLGGGA